MILLLAAHVVSGASLAEGIDRLLAANAAAKTAFWGIQVVDLASGKTLYELNADHYFVPASNTKLFTTALALTRLGPDYTFVTRVLAASAPDAAGRVAGPLRLIGGGDPNLSARAIPYRMGPTTGDPLGPIEDLAQQIFDRGVRRVAGDIIGDDTRYVWQPYAVGWGIDDPESDDGPPISALTINDNTVTITMQPGARDGDPAIVSVRPPIEFYRIDNRVRTVAGGERHINVSRIPGSLDVHLWGETPARGRAVDHPMSIEDPARYAAMALRRALEDRGIVVEGEAVAEHLYPQDAGDLLQGPADAGGAVGVQVAHRVSAPLLEDLRITDKVSQNLHAELALRAVARARRNVGSFEAGFEEMKTFLTEAGIAPESYNFRDGSGLARLNLVTPGAVIKLLRHMYGGPHRDEWISMLPVGGRDGSLSTRFGETPAAGRVHAKTGSLSHVSALSGYIQRNDGSWVAFSILTNNYHAQTAEVRGVMDRICNLIVE